MMEISNLNANKLKSWIAIAVSDLRGEVQSAKTLLRKVRASPE